MRTCGRSDCQEVAETVSTWRSESGRLWETIKCTDHVTPVPPLPGFALVAMQRLGSGESPAAPATTGDAGRESSSGRSR